MLKSRKGVLARMLPLLGLVLALFMAVGHAEAQNAVLPSYNYSTVADYAFPYLSPEPAQKNIIFNAFTSQMRLFGGVDGTGSNGVDALRYLALAAFLIGALMLIFNAKHRKGPIVAAWLLLVIITLFGPYGSKMLFYPLSSSAILSQGESTSVADCASDAERRCGFTPQLAAIHVAATLQLVFSDMFQSQQWTGLIESARAAHDLTNAEKLSSISWRPKKQELMGQCTWAVSWEQAIDHRVKGGDSEGDLIIPTNLGEEWTSLKAKYALWDRLGDEESSESPNAIILYGKEAIPDTWGADARKAYVEGISKFYSAVGGKKGVYLDESPSGGDNGTSISLDDALTFMEEKGFFEAKSECGQCPLPTGYFFILKKNADTNLTESPAAEMRRCWGTPRGGYGGDRTKVDLKDNKEWTEKCDATMSSELTSQYIPNKQMLAFREHLHPNGDFAGTQWKDLLQGGDQLVEHPLANMPIGVATFVPNSNKVADLPSVTSNPGKSCFTLWNQAIDVAIIDTLGKPEKYTVQLNPLKELLLSTDRKVVLNEGKLPPIFKEKPGESKYPCTNGSENADGDASFAMCSNTKLANDIRMAFESQYRSAVLAASTKDPSIKELTPEDNYKILLRVVIGAIDGASERFKPQTAAEKQAEKDGDKTEVKGWELLSDVGAWGAKLFGTLLVHIGAWFTGALAIAFIHFLSLLVNMALMILIVLTPILFLFGLAMPGAAVGLLTISILGAFILKFVPVTLLIINNIGAMIYDMLGYGPDGSTMQSMMILAMAGLYLNIVGLTFFLLFKMGDASAMLSRFTALDGSAKQIAESGKAATIAAAALATAAIGGGLAATAGGSRLAAGAKAAARKAGISDGAIAMLAGSEGVKEDLKKNAQGSTPDNPDSANPDGSENTENLNADGSAAGVDSSVLDGTRVGEDNLKLASFFDTEEKRLGRKLTEDEKTALRNKETLSLTGPGGKRVLSGESLSSYVDTSENTENVVGEAGLPQLAAKVEGSQAAAASSAVATVEGGASGAADQTQMRETPTSGAGAVSSGAIPQKVTIDGGKLDSVGEVSVATQAAVGESASDVQNLVKQEQAKRDASELVDQNEAAASYVDRIANENKLSPEQKRQFEDDLKRYTESSDAQERAGILRDMEGRAMALGGSSKVLSEADSAKIATLSQQIGFEMARLERSNPDLIQKIEKNEPLNANEQEFADYYKKLRDIDTTKASLGQIMDQYSGLQNLNASIEARKGADLAPKWYENFASGVYGSVSGSGGGLARIPVIGPAITESVNEYYQAPERAKAVKALGGVGNWWKAQGDAQRMGFYQKEMAPIGAATQYQTMQALGGFQAQADIARTAAAEAVARSRSQWEAMIATQNPNLKAELAQQIRLDKPSLVGSDFENELGRRFNERIQKMDVHLEAKDVRGLGMIDANFKMQSLRKEAELLSGRGGGVIKYESMTGLDANHLLQKDEAGRLVLQTESRKAILTPDLLAKFGGDAAAKGFAGNLDGMLVTAYGLIEKQFQRGTSEWNASRDMAVSGTRGARAAASFVAEDVSTDYLVSGHLKMVQGKERFMEMRGQYSTLLNFRNDSNKMISERINSLMQEHGNDWNKAIDAAIGSKLRNIKANPGSVDFDVDARASLDKWAADDLKSQGVVLPLNIIFDAATTKGKSSYMRKAMTAIYDEQSEAADNFVAMQKAAADAYAAQLPDAQNFTRKMALEYKGVKYDIGAAHTRLFEKIYDVAGSRVSQVDKIFMDYLSKHQTEITSTIDKEQKTASMRLSSNAWSNIISDIRTKVGDAMADRFQEQLKDGFNSKNFRTLDNGDVEFGALDAKQNKEF